MIRSTLFHHQHRTRPTPLARVIAQLIHEYGALRAIGSCTILPLVGCLLCAIGVLTNV